MSVKSSSRLLVVLLVFVLLSAGAGPQAYGAPATPSAPALPYTGRLADTHGKPVADGGYDFRFAIYESESGGIPLWEETHLQLTVRDGAFEAPLGALAPMSVTLEARPLWLAVSVRGPGEAEFTTLAPRQSVADLTTGATSSPAAGPACPHDHWGETWTGSGAAGLVFENPTLTHTVYVPNWLSALFAVSEVWAGVHGKSTQNIGVLGESTSGTGVHGKSSTGYGGFFESNSDHNDLFLGGAVGRINTDPENQNSNLILSSNNDVDVRIDNDGGETALFTVWGSAFEACNINENGNLKCFGTKSAVVDTADHGARRLYSMESPEVWFEDVGAARLGAGEVNVKFEPVFVQTVNLREEYHVFLTATCADPVLLFVTGKSADGFTVNGVGLDGTPSSCGFDYRIVAKRLGYEELRLDAEVSQREVGQ